MLFFRGPFPAGNDLEAFGALTESSDYPIKYGYMNVGETADSRRVFAFYPHQSEFVCPEDQLIVLPDTTGDDDAVFLPSMETAFQITHDTAPRLGEWVVVFGLGVIGTLVTLLLLRTGARVVAGDPRPERRNRLEREGVATFDPEAPLATSVLMELTNGGPDLAVNTSAAHRALQLAIDTLRAEGTVVEASWYGSTRANLSLGAAFHRKRLRIRSSQVSHLNPEMAPRWQRSRRTASVIDLLDDVHPARFISHRFALDDAARAYRLIDEGHESVFQVVLEP